VPTGWNLRKKDGWSFKVPDGRSFRFPDGRRDSMDATSRSPFRYLFTVESGGTYGRTQVFLIPRAGWPSSGARTAFLRSQTGLPSGPERSSSRPERPSSSSRTGFLHGQGGLPPAPGQAASVARAAFLQLQDRLPPWPGRPASSSRTGYVRGQGGPLPALGQASSVAKAINP
jgi:hypothetical protein